MKASAAKGRYRRFLHHVGAAAHDDDDVFRIRGAHVIEQVIATAGELAHLVHIVLHDAGDGVILFVGGFPALEVDIRVLGGAAQVGMLGVHGPGAEGFDRLKVAQLGHVVVIDDLHLLHLVGGTEAVEEMDEGHAALDGGQVGDQGQVHDLLHGGGSQHGKPGLAAAHHVAMIAEDGQGVIGQGPGGNVEHARQQLAGDLIHVGDHQQQALGSGKGGGQRAALEGAVNRAGGAGFRLHFRDLYLLAEQVQPTVCSPVVCNLRHGGGRLSLIHI